MGKVISVWGAPNTGKTTLSIKLAKELSKECTVMLVFTDLISPVIPTIFKEADKDKTLGNVLSAPSLTEEVILKNSISIKGNKNLGIIGYKEYDNVFTYPQFSKERAIEFIQKIRAFSDYIILDLSSFFVNDMLSTTALEISDEIIRVSSPSLKDISYYDSYLPLINTADYSLEHHINVISMFRENDAVEELAELYNAEERIPYMDELREQSMCGDLFNSLSSRNEQKIKNIIDNLMYIIDYEENEADETECLSANLVKENGKKGLFSKFNFRKREA